jgi:hypothetical protein
MSIRIALGIALLVFSGGLSWKVHSWYSASKELLVVQETLDKERLYAIALVERAGTLEKANNAKSTQLAAARRDADRSRVALVSLSGSIESTLRDAGTSQSACLERAATLGELFDASGEALRGLAEKADRHVVDVKALRSLGFKISAEEH